MAPLSITERKRRYRAKLSEERREEVKQQDRQRKKEKNVYCLDIGAKRIKTKERERKRLYRKKQKFLKVKLGQSVFRNSQTKGKAI